MSTESVIVTAAPSDSLNTNSAAAARLLCRDDAAAHLGIPNETYRKLQKRGIFRSDLSAEQLEDILAELCAKGLPWPTPTRKSQWRPFPYTQPLWTTVQGGLLRLHARWRHYPEAKSIKHPFGSADWVKEWFACERRYAEQHKTAPVPRLDQSPSVAQPRRQADTDITEFVTRHQAADEAHGLPPRRRSAITQAEIARVIRAAKQAGAPQIELRLSDSARILIRLQADNSVASDDKEIIL
jgi:hypothetical protein